MKILITNDDGIDSVGIRVLLAEALKRGHECYVSAPERQCSANSQHISLYAPLFTRKVNTGAEHCVSYAVSGTPADCVRVSRDLFGTDIDVCISGINDGENAGAAVYYSGTVSAAREAAMQGLPAVAVSAMPRACENARLEAARAAVSCAEMLVRDRVVLPPMGVMNLNFPASEPESWGETRSSTLSRSCFHDVYLQREVPKTGEKYFWVGPGYETDEPEEGSDWYWLRRGCPTWTVLGAFQDRNGEYAGKMQELLHKTCKP